MRKDSLVTKFQLILHDWRNSSCGEGAYLGLRLLQNYGSLFGDAKGNTGFCSQGVGFHEREPRTAPQTLNAA